MYEAKVFRRSTAKSLDLHVRVVKKSFALTEYNGDLRVKYCEFS